MKSAFQQRTVRQRRDVTVSDSRLVPVISRLRGLFARSADGMNPVDLGSTNGCAVNGESARRAVLEDNDVAAVGGAHTIYSEKTAEEADDKAES